MAANVSSGLAALSVKTKTPISTHSALPEQREHSEEGYDREPVFIREPFVERNWKSFTCKFPTLIPAISGSSSLLLHASHSLSQPFDKQLRIAFGKGVGSIVPDRMVGFGEYA